MEVAATGVVALPLGHGAPWQCSHAVDVRAFGHVQPGDHAGDVTQLFSYSYMDDNGWHLGGMAASFGGNPSSWLRTNPPSWT